MFCWRWFHLNWFLLSRNFQVHLLWLFSSCCAVKAGCCSACSCSSNILACQLLDTSFHLFSTDGWSAVFSCSNLNMGNHIIFSCSAVEGFVIQFQLILTVLTCLAKQGFGLVTSQPKGKSFHLDAHLNQKRAAPNNGLWLMALHPQAVSSYKAAQCRTCHRSQLANHRGLGNKCWAIPT